MLDSGPNYLNEPYLVTMTGAKTANLEEMNML